MEVGVYFPRVTPRFNIVTLVIKEFDHELFSLIQEFILGREHKRYSLPSPTFLTSQKVRLGMIVVNFAIHIHELRRAYWMKTGD